MMYLDILKRTAWQIAEAKGHHDTLRAIPLVVVVSVLVACSAHAAADLRTVGALTPFDLDDALDLADYCNGGDQGDDTACIGTWLSDAKTQGRHLYVSPGTYLYAKDRVIFNGFHLQCASPTQAIFKAMNNASTLFVLAANRGVTAEPWQDISIENCGFDVNGTTANYATVITLLGHTMPVRYVTVRGNRVYDSTQPGQMYTARDRQRQYMLILKAEDVLVEQNHLSEGGRIKVGRPGRRIVIRHNTLHNINDNGITVADLRDGLSSDILIEHNTITSPLGSGIFFGADGQPSGTATMQLFDVTIRNNVVLGDFQAACISGVLPNNVARIFLADNTCRKTGPTPPGVFTGGIVLTRNNTATLYARDITLQDNALESDVVNAYNALAGIFVSDRFDNLCLIGNQIYDTGRAIWLRSAMPSVKATDNDLHGGIFRIGANVHVDQSGNTSGCFVANPLLEGTP